MSVKGLVHYSAADLFKMLTEEASDMQVSATMFEIYIDQIRDLIPAESSTGFR